MVDPGLKDRAARLLRSMLPPKVKRGRPGIHAVTTAIRLLRRLKRECPQERPAELWKPIYPKAVPGYAAMTPIEKKTAREVLRASAMEKR